MEKNADYQISFSVNDGILEIIMTGKLRKSEHDKMSKEVIALIDASSAKNMLMDIRNLNGRLSITETYESVRHYPSHIYSTNIALVDIPENSDYQSFHENTAVNAGMKLKIFTDIVAARTWLKSK